MKNKESNKEAVRCIDRKYCIFPADQSYHKSTKVMLYGAGSPPLRKRR